MHLRGDVYSNGSWALRAASNYDERYKYSGLFDLGYAINITGDPGTPDYTKNKDFSIRWTHSQDPKAHPNSRFSANVNIESSKYNTDNPVSTQDYLTNTLESNVSFSTTFGSIANFSVNMRHSQNTLTRDISLYLPDVAFSVNRFYPFRNESKGVVKHRWYDDISVAYSMAAENFINTKDTLLFYKHTAELNQSTLKQMQNGMDHTIPISWSGKVFKNFNWTNSFNYNERWYLQSIEKHWVDTGSTNYLRNDTLQGFKAARDFNFSSSLTTRLYGMLTFKKGKIMAIRHVLTPTVSFTYAPDFGSPAWGYYRYLYNEQKPTAPLVRYYSIFEIRCLRLSPQWKAGLRQHVAFEQP